MARHAEHAVAAAPAVPGFAPGPSRRAARLRVLEPWFYVGPVLTILGLVMVVPLIVGLSYAFRSVELYNPLASEWIGFAHFRELASDENFRVALGNTVTWTFGSLIFQLLLGLGLALLLNRPFAGRRLVQALVFVPWAVPTFLSGLTWAWLFNPVIGPVAHWLAWVGLIAEPYNILADPDTALWGPITANVWYGVPFFAITLLASLQAIPGELYEAAAIDGAGAWAVFTRVTLPFLAPTIVITVLLRTIWISNFADLIWVMTGGGPANATQILASYIFSTAYTKLDFGYASAVATALLVLLLLYAAVLIRVRRSILGGR